MNDPEASGRDPGSVVNYALFALEKESFMNKAMIALAALMLIFAGCSPKSAAPSKPVTGSPAYLLAKELAAKLPSLDPDKNTVLVESRSFAVTTNDVLQMFYETMGTKTEQIRGLEPERWKSIFNDGAGQIAEKKLLLAAAAQAKVAGTPEEVNAALEAQYAQAGGKAQFDEMVRSQGVTVENVRANISDSVTLNKFLQGILSAQVKIGEDDVRKAYEADKTASVRHILLLTQGKSDAEKTEIRKKMEGILVRARAGEDFAGLAKEFSEDPGSKDNGGLYEDKVRGTWAKPFEDAAFSVPVGQISGIVETNYGYHVLKVENRKKETAPYEEVKAQLEAQMRDSRQSAAFETYLADLKAKAKFKAIPLV
jgi:parvulin-like peptidyl-prolyl isomerase